jgi:hypothetical protein
LIGLNILSTFRLVICDDVFLGGVIVFAIFSDAIHFALYLIDYSRTETPRYEEGIVRDHPAVLSPHFCVDHGFIERSCCASSCSMAGKKPLPRFF